MTWHFTSALIGTMMLAVALPVPASAQQSDPSARTAQSDQGAATRPTPKPAKPVVRTDAAQNAKTSNGKTSNGKTSNAKTSTAKTSEAQGRPWNLQDAMPDHSASMRQYDTRPASPPIGRVPLQSGPGTLGFETKTQVDPNKTPDGGTVRGQEATAARSSTYVGMSLSVPTTDKAMNFPLPWARP